MGLVQVVPTHLVHADGEQGFQPGVDAPVQQSGQHQLVDEEGGGVTQVEDEGVAQADGLAGIGQVVGQQLEQGFVAVPGGVKIAQDLGALGFRVRAIQAWGAGKECGWHGLGDCF
jgi:hypothetical protein